MAVKPSSTALDISSEGSPVMPSVRVLYQPKPLQQNRATAEMESAHQLVEELAGPLFQMQTVADGEAHQDGQHHGRHAGCLDDGIDADGDGTEPEQGGQVIFQPAIKPVIDLSIGLCFARLHIFARSTSIICPASSRCRASLHKSLFAKFFCQNISTSFAPIHPQPTPTSTPPMMSVG